MGGPTPTTGRMNHDGRVPDGWDWDETLYAGCAEYYERGRLPYPTRLADSLAAALALDGSGRLIDVGCGPGIIALTLAHLFAEVVGVYADQHMVEQAARRAADRQIANTSWVVMRAEDLPADLGRFRAVTFGQSFHWLDRAQVAAAAYRMLEPGCAVVLVKHWSMEGDPVPESMYPAPPHDEIKQLVERYLGPTWRAGRGVRPAGLLDDEEAVLAEAGFEAPDVIPVPGGEVVTASAGDIIARYFSASGSAPHLFGSERDAFEQELTALLYTASRSGSFAERVRDSEVGVWRTARPA